MVTWSEEKTRNLTTKSLEKSSQERRKTEMEDGIVIELLRMEDTKEDEALKNWRRFVYDAYPLM